MQTFYRICLLCCLSLVSFFAGIGVFIFFILQNNYIIINKDIYTTPQSKETVQAVEVTNYPEKVDLATQYVVNHVDTVTGNEITEVENLPSALIGCDRKGVETFLAEYNKAPSLTDRQKGFVNMQLKEFSNHKIEIDKFYTPLEEDVFYLKSEENFVVVYYSDLSTVYMYTDIVVDTLSEETRKELAEGKKITSLESLYSFLESSTS